MIQRGADPPWMVGCCTVRLAKNATCGTVHFLTTAYCQKAIEGIIQQQLVLSLCFSSECGRRWKNCLLVVGHGVAVILMSGSIGSIGMALGRTRMPTCKLKTAIYSG
jgi:hypothetical protein